MTSDEKHYKISESEQVLVALDGLYTTGFREPIMSDQDTSARPLFQPRPGTDGISARYLLWKISAKVVVSPSGCWEWTGGKTARGYGLLTIRAKSWPTSTVLLHRVAFEVCVGELLDGLCVCHRCDNPPCLRPDHLFAGTNLDNIADKIAKGRQRGARGELQKNSKLTAAEVMEIRQRAANGELIVRIAEEFGMGDSHISAVIRGKCWAHLPLVEKKPSEQVEG